MTTILFIESSIFPPQMSASRNVGKQLVDGLIEQHPGAKLIHRDLAAEPLSHISLDLMAGSMAAPEARTEAQAKAVARSDVLIKELLEADILVIGAPMYNFGVPSALKAWIDHVVIAGKTFRYNAEGRPEGLVTGTRAFVVASRGGVYSEGPAAALNFQDTYLRTVLGHLGIQEVTVITAERQAMGPEPKAFGLSQAQDEIANALATV